jgi:hypothetical protein
VYFLASGAADENFLQILVDTVPDLSGRAICQNAESIHLHVSVRI